MIIVCSLSRAQRLIDEHGARHVVSLLAPETPHQRFPGVARKRHLRLSFHDISQPMEGYAAPRSADAERLMDFVKTWDRQAPLLIHCWAGISRSTAAAYAALCLLEPPGSEEALALRLRQASPSATPNKMIVALTDQLLGREGRMVRAIEKIGRGVEASEGTPFFLDHNKP
jgi:predicted protein tyrosine phosphatase